MKKTLILCLLLASFALQAQKLITLEQNTFSQNTSYYLRLNGYQTHFNLDSNWFCFYNNTDTLSYWLNASFAPCFINQTVPIYFKGTGFYHLMVYNSSDDTMFLPKAIYIVPSKPNYCHFQQEKFLRTGVQGQKEIIVKGVNNTHFISNQLFYGYFFNSNGQIDADSIIPLSEDSLKIYFQLDTSSIGFYNFLYFNDVDSFLLLQDAIFVENDLKTEIALVTPDSLNNLYPFIDTVYVYGNKTHFSMDTNYLSIQYFGYPNSYIHDIEVINDTMLRFSLTLPIPIKQALNTNSILQIYNPTDSLMFYPIRIDIYGGGVSNTKQKIHDLKIYPNPAPEFVILELDYFPSNEQLEMTLLDMNGKLVEKSRFNAEERISMDISNLKNGIYMIFIYSTHGETWLGKFLKE